MDWQPDYIYIDKTTLHGRKGCSSYDWNRQKAVYWQIATLVYRGNERGNLFFTLIELMKIENTLSFQLDGADQLLLVLMKLYEQSSIQVVVIIADEIASNTSE